MRKLLRISYLEHKTNDWVQSNINFLVGPQELLATDKRRKLAWLGRDTSTSLQFASLYDGQEVFVWTIYLLNLGTEFLVGNLVFVEMRTILR